MGGNRNTANSLGRPDLATVKPQTMSSIVNRLVGENNSVHAFWHLLVTPSLLFTVHTKGVREDEIV